LSKAYDTLKVEREESVLWIILNRPHRLNAFNDVLMEELSDILETAEKDSSVKCVVVTGEGDRAFSAGADLTMFSKATPVKAEGVLTVRAESFRENRGNIQTSDSFN